MYVNIWLTDLGFNTHFSFRFSTRHISNKAQLTVNNFSDLFYLKNKWLKVSVYRLWESYHGSWGMEN